jgi:hypothetical protein
VADVLRGADRAPCPRRCRLRPPQSRPGRRSFGG